MKISGISYRLRKGFTLAELLIVVVVIAILVAIAIPFFNSKLEKSREAYDIHLTRTAASAAQEMYYAGVHDEQSAHDAGMEWWPNGNNSDAFAIYDPSTGGFIAGYTEYIKKYGIKGYGKGTKTDGKSYIKDISGQYIYSPSSDYTKAVCQVSIIPNGNPKRVEVSWKEVRTSGRPFIGNSGNKHPVYTIYLD